MPQGLRHFFPTPPLATTNLRVLGIGVREAMHPGVVDRPAGTGDYLFMLFYDSVELRIDGQPLVAGARTLMLWTPEHGHYYGNRERRWRHSWIHCDGRSVTDLVRSLGLPIARPIVDADPGSFERFLLGLYQELTGPFAPDECIAHHQLEIWLRETRRYRQDRTIRRAPPAPFLDVKAFLETNYARPIHLSELARRMRLSPQYLSSRFKHFFGMGPIAYLLRQRLQRAAYLLRDHNLTIGEVGQRVGYDDIFQFSKMFKREFGVSPRALRQRLSEGQ